MKRPIAIGLAPNVQSKDAWTALQRIINPVSYKNGSQTQLLERWFEKYFLVHTAVAFTSGRGALYAILRGLSVGKGDEVLLQAFTCAAVAQAILTTGAKPVYLDIDETYGIDTKTLEKKVTQKTKAIIVQHTFGIAADMENLQRIVNEHNIFLIEDAAHTIGGTYKKKKLGTFGIASIFSLGRDKAFSCVSGGVAITSDKTLGKSLQTFAKQKGYPSTFWIFQQLLHVVSFYFFVLPFYNILLGKVILVVLQKLGLLSLPVDTKRVTLVEEEVKKLPPALSSLALLQLKSLDVVNAKRISICRQYQQELDIEKVTQNEGPLLRFPILVKDPKKWIAYFRKQHIYVGNWYSNTIDPKGVRMEKLGYTRGSCPRAEEVARKIINLPTYASLSDREVTRIITKFKIYAQRQGNNK